MHIANLTYVHEAYLNLVYEHARVLLELSYAIIVSKTSE